MQHKVRNLMSNREPLTGWRMGRINDDRIARVPADLLVTAKDAGDMSTEIILVDIDAQITRKRAYVNGGGALVPPYYLQRAVCCLPREPGGSRHPGQGRHHHRLPHLLSLSFGEPHPHA
jgi:hypothetical protein